ncbi:hypothetical protein LB505_006446 [Fusarium chuoi]|nr:hypothetical protein LB505_006446 [Fusarium chuoi]
MRLSKSIGLAFVSLVAAQEWVAAPKGLEVVSSKLFNGAEISGSKQSLHSPNINLHRRRSRLILLRQHKRLPLLRKRRLQLNDPE